MVTCEILVVMIITACYNKIRTKESPPLTDQQGGGSDVLTCEIILFMIIITACYYTI